MIMSSPTPVARHMWSSCVGKRCVLHTYRSGSLPSDVLTLTTAFGTLREILQASEEDLSSCAGLGPTKVKRLYDAFHSDFYPKVPGAGKPLGESGGQRKRARGAQEGGTGKSAGAGEGDGFDIEDFL